MKSSITKLDSPVHSGDWHDKPLRWEIKNELGERQLFSTKREAEQWRAIRNRSASFSDAMTSFLNAS